VREALRYAKREDLIGNTPDCLVRPATTREKNMRDGSSAAKDNGTAKKSMRKPAPKSRTTVARAKKEKAPHGHTSFGGRHQKKGKKR
jgi:ribosomal protein L4